MNRVIKFRAWLKDKEIMLYPGSQALEGSCNEGYAHLEQVFDGHSHNEGDIWDATDSILMQFTGLTDKNGKEIYEGDVIAWPEDGAKSSVVIFEKCAFRKKYQGWASWLDNPPLSQWDIDNGLVVIGNIFENRGDSGR